MSGRARGVALVNALIVVAALAAISTALLLRADAARQRLEVQRSSDQMQIYLRGGALIVQDLLTDAAASGGGAIHMDQDWARAVDEVQIDRGRIGWRMDDLQGRFNVNWLVRGVSDADPDQSAPGLPTAQLARAAFERLARSAGASTLIAARLADALDPVSGRRSAAFDSDHQPPVLPLQSVAQLRNVRGVDGDMFARLEPLLAALPPQTGLNLNTALPEVLAAVVPNPSAVSRLTRTVAERPFDTDAAAREWIEAVLEQDAPGVIAAFAPGASSQWFAARLVVRLDVRLDMRVQRQTLVLHRDVPDRPAAIHWLEQEHE